ncbi:MAG TPA: polysaccharide biosynthesis tyrosine autokinase, partial [Candidatus Baltobacteraceae bacterium]
TANSSLPLLNALLSQSGTQTAETYAELLQETPPAERVIEQLDLNITPGELLSHIKVKPITDTAILTASVSWHNAAQSAAIANSLATAFVDYRRDMVSQQAQTALDYLGTQLPQAEAQVHRTATALTQYEAAHKIVDMTQQTQNRITTNNDVEARIAALQVEQSQAQAQLSDVRAQIAAMPATMSGDQQTAPNPILSELQTQLAQVTVQLHDAQAHYTDEHPTVISLKQQQSELQHAISLEAPTVVSARSTIPNPVYQQLLQQSATLQAQLAADASQSGVLRQQLAGLQPSIAALPAEAAQLDTLQRRAKLAQDVYDELQRKNGEAMVDRSSALSDVTVVEPARADDADVFPNTKVNLILGAFLGLLLGIGVALAADSIDTRLRVENEVEQRLALPVLASFPLAGPRELAALPWLQSVTIESYFQFVTALRYASSTRLRTIAVTSARQGEGKSTVAVNTAIALAEVEPRILLIDGDLRRPSLHTKLGIRPSQGLSDILVGTAVWEDVIQPTKHAGLDLLAAGTRTPNSYRLLQSEQFDELLARAAESYKTIIIDSPAVEPIIDAAILAAHTDGTVFVIASNETDTNVAKTAIAKLRSAGVRNILGAVLNKTNAQRNDELNQYYLDADERPALA